MSLKEKTQKNFVIHPLVWPNMIEERLYQQTITDKAIKKNTIVVLPTALGKTIISALTAAHFLYNYKDMRILVMAPTKPLVVQHKDSFMKVLKLRDVDASILTGKIPSIYRKLVWEGDAKIIFATPQVIENDLKNGYLTLKEFSLLIFDECHRARKNYAYTYVAKRYVEQSPWPKILGLTASPGAERSKIEEICKALFIENLEYRSEEDTDVLPYIHHVKVEWKYVKLPKEYLMISSFIRDMLADKLNWLHRSGLIHKNPKYVGRRDLLKVGEDLRFRLEESINEEKGKIFNAIIIQSAALTLTHAIELLETQGIPILTSFLERVEEESKSKKSYKTIISDPRYYEIKKLLTTYKRNSHPKVQLLVDEVKEELARHDQSKILVFTQYRDTVSHLVDQFKSSRVSVERFVGQSSKIGDYGLTQDEQAEILERFREGDIDLLVATCIAEEGLDIPSVELVIFYEPIPSEIRYIQRKGRTGRKTAGRAVILAAHETYDMAYLYASKRRVEKMRQITGHLNQELNPLFRLGQKPVYNRLSKEEIEKIEKKAAIFREEPYLYKSEEEKIKDFIKNADRAIKQVYENILRTGEKGILIEDLVNEMESETGFAPTFTKAAIEKLKEMGEISIVGLNRAIISSCISKPQYKVVDDKGVYDVFVEKIYPGVAVVLINDKWRARVTPQNFEGPTVIMKKNVRFKARGTLFHENGKLCLIVKEILELLS